MLGSRLLSVALLVVLLVGLGTAGYLQVAGRAGESSPQAATPPPPSPSPRAEPRAAPTHASRPTPTPSPTPEPTPSPAEARPPSSEPVPVEPPAGDAYTEDEYRAIYEELQARSSQLATKPGFSPDDLHLFFTEECQCWEDYYQFLADMRAAGEYTAGPPPMVLNFDVMEVAPDGSFTARIVDQQKEATQRLAVDGSVIEEYPPGAPFESEVRVTPTPEGWRTTSLIFITEQPS